MADTGNIYAVSRLQALDRFRERLSGSESGLIAVLSHGALDERSRDALDKSFAALGYGPGACTYALVDGLEWRDVFDLVEGLDPLVLVAADHASAQLAAQAGGGQLPFLRPVLLFGRDARAFENLPRMLETEEGRQMAWHMLKSLPRGD